MLYAVCTDKGIKREQNEDCIYGDGRLFIVADGMGGHSAGEVASAMAVDVVSEILKNCENDFEENIIRAINKANEVVKRDAVHEKAGMGTTIDVCIVDNDEVHIGHVGDSRVYILHKDIIEQITDDHSYVQMLLDKGEITEDEVKGYPMKNMITRAVGVSETVKTDYYTKKLQPGDVLVMATDGLTNMIADEEIAAIISHNDSLTVSVSDLIKKANENGGDDNISVILADCFAKGE